MDNAEVVIGFRAAVESINDGVVIHDKGGEDYLC
jgi:hypothetical protein